MTARILCLLLLITLLPCSPLQANEEATNPAQQTDEEQAQTVIDTLIKLNTVRDNLNLELTRLQQDLKQPRGDNELADPADIQNKIDSIQQELNANRNHFDRVALGIDTTIETSTEKQKFELQKELQLIFEPLFKELKQSTRELRKKSDIKESITQYQELMLQVQQAIHNLQQLLSLEESDSVKKSLQQLLQHWNREKQKLQSSLEAAQLELELIERNSVSFSDASHRFFKEFFRERGLYLAEAIGTVMLLLLLFRLLHKGMVKLIPGYRNPHPSLSIRLLDLIYRIITILILFMTPLAVFYLREDWVLFSVVLLILIGAAWGVRKAITFYWQQAILLLNIGSVREGERIFYEGLPWKVDKINLYTELFNPAANLRLRIPLESLVGCISRPIKRGTEHWFPCSEGEWVILDDGTRGEVVSITHEYVLLQQRGGASKTYLIQDFLAQAPLNISTTFRIKEEFGISYKHQKESTNIIIGKLRQYIQEQIEKEGQQPYLVDLKVEFNQAADSSLNLIILADFKGEMAPLMNRLRRSIQRWCVDAATRHEWEIPFPQLTLHSAD